MDTQPRSLQILLIAGVLALAAFPLVGEKFYIQFITKIMILAMFAMSLDLLVGYTGLVSLGHALPFGLAAYALMFVSPEAEGAGLGWILAAAAGVAALASLVVGLLVLRTSGIYFIMVTMAFVYLTIRVLLASPFGRVIAAIKENEHRMRMLGFATFRYKLVCFVLAGALAGLAGWLTAAHDGLVNPE